MVGCAGRTFFCFFSYCSYVLRVGIFRKLQSHSWRRLDGAQQQRRLLLAYPQHIRISLINGRYSSQLRSWLRTLPTSRPRSRLFTSHRWRRNCYNGRRTFEGHFARLQKNQVEGKEARLMVTGKERESVEAGLNFSQSPPSQSGESSILPCCSLRCISCLIQWRDRKLLCHVILTTHFCSLTLGANKFLDWNEMKRKMGVARWKSFWVQLLGRYSVRHVTRLI